jgi:tetratricopeptide (TPR) repeat protein
MGHSQEAIEVYDLVDARYGTRQEPALAEQVAKALGGKGWLQYELGSFEASVASSRAVLSRSPGETWIRCNLALALLHLGEIDDAKAAYAEALQEIATPEDLDRMALQDLDAALARQPDLQGAAEIREMLSSRQWG